ncbi:hypothetical protein [Schlesneria paludicola]|uniref:hypothetical protein n=1 Tax=Schlesneria paludicola TaxID=360056 RepID=UPI00029A50F9|nr:hypothetical protein [Schlesneria paludicola]
MSSKHERGTKLIIGGFALPVVGYVVGGAIVGALFELGPPPNQGAMLVQGLIVLVSILVAILLVVIGICDLIEGDREEYTATKADDMKAARGSG